ncbi:GntR family transcriptional regulator [Alloiococcus sp. CFN-8]|uniref:GntR family transcriptional regulator n=1 Tax=Alloiococcus sp. CFN-8 TaxID=3416081 RepID=UPI003CE74656
MEIRLNRNSGGPLYLQVKSQIMDMINQGELKVGYKMPTERELSRVLGISRNTISSAYKELELEGVLKSIQGKGTFISEQNTVWKMRDSKEKIYKFLDLAFEEAIGSGISGENFLELVARYTEEKIDKMNKTTAIYVECNVEQSRMFSTQLSYSTDMLVVPITINDLRNMDDKTKKAIEDSQIIVSTFNHVSEVSRLTAAYKKEILGVAINADLGTIVKIARYPSSTKFGFFCMSEEFMFKIKQALEEAGLGDINIQYSNSYDKEVIQEIVDSSDVILVSPGRYKDIEVFNHDKKDVIKFIYNLDEGSVKALKSKIIELNIPL